MLGSIVKWMLRQPLRHAGCRRYLEEQLSLEVLLLGNSRSILAHPLVQGMPKISLTSQSAADRPDRIPIAKRLIEAYRRARADQPRARLQPPQDDLWTNLVEAEFKQLLQILNAEDAPALAEFLMHFGEQYTWFGGLTLSVDGFNQKRDPSSVALSYLDKLVCLAESQRVLTLESPEQTVSWGRNMYLSPDEILERLEQAIGISVATPTGVVPVTGLDTSRGPLHYRHFNSLYAALRIKTLLPAGGAVCEYGGGLGVVAYYAYQLGFRDYSIFDLPLVNVFAANFLMNALGPQAVRLYGEDGLAATVNVLPYWECMCVPSEIYALALNQDSFPEIDDSLVREYVRQIQRTTTRYFLSINQEAEAAMGTRKQNSVPFLMSQFDAFHRMYRFKYWVREGYAEELYELRAV